MQATPLRPDSNKRLLVPVLIGLILVTVGYRVFSSQFDGLGNTAPLMAIAFGGALLLGPRYFWIPLVLLVLSDLALGLWNPSGGLGFYTVASMLFYLAVAGLARSIGGSRRNLWIRFWTGTLLCSVAFYLFANTYAWLAFPGYIHSLGGWWQAQTTGLPEFSPPAWVFLRNAILADTIWCFIAMVCYLILTRPRTPASESEAIPTS
ncbi:MAG: DUF6580 family putative transport protein [Verrucomicrobiota bacterium]